MSDKQEPRFDVYLRDGCSLSYHFCREWDNDEGCYGTNPNHGYSFEEAKQEIVRFYERQAAYWQKITPDEWEAPYSKTEDDRCPDQI